MAAMAQKQERRNEMHESLADQVADLANNARLPTARSDYIDLLVDSKIMIEVKTIQDDTIRQSRAALAQLYHYRFEYRETLIQPTLAAIFNARPTHTGKDLSDFLESCGIAVAWKSNDGFDGTESSRRSLPWIFER